MVIGIGGIGNISTVYPNAVNAIVNDRLKPKPSPSHAPPPTSPPGKLAGLFTGSQKSSRAERDARRADRMQKQQMGAAGGAISSMEGTASQLGGMGSSMFGVGMGGLGTAMSRLSGSQLSEAQGADRGAIDTGLAFDKALGIQQRNLGRMGINPNSGRFAGLQQEFAMGRAAAEAGARNRGRREAFNRNVQIAGQLGQLGSSAASRGLGAVGQAGSLFGGASDRRRALGEDYGRYAGEAAQAAGMQSSGAITGERQGDGFGFNRGPAASISSGIARPSSRPAPSRVTQNRQHFDKYSDPSYARSVGRIGSKISRNTTRGF